jgi:hypothetical protein
MATATSNFVLSKGYDAQGAIVARTFVKWYAEETVQKMGTGDPQTVIPVGVAMFDVTSTPIFGQLSDATRGKGASVAVEGAAEVFCDGVIAVGDPITVSVAAGKEGFAKKAVATNRVVGYARTSGVDGGICSVQLDLPGSIM